MLASLRPLSRHLGLTALPRLRRTPGETSIQDWRASYGNVDVVSFPLWTTVMAGRSWQMSHCSGFQPLVYIVVCSLADYYLGFGRSWFGNPVVPLASLNSGIVWVVHCHPPLL